MKPIADGRHDYDDADMTIEHADMTIEQIVARIRWLDEMLTALQRELAAAANRDDRSSSAIFRIH
jgi:hypothetical protein